MLPYSVSPGLYGETHFITKCRCHHSQYSVCRWSLTEYYKGLNKKITCLWWSSLLAERVLAIRVIWSVTLVLKKIACSRSFVCCSVSFNLQLYLVIFCITVFLTVNCAMCGYSCHWQEKQKILETDFEDFELLLNIFCIFWCSLLFVQFDK